MKTQSCISTVLDLKIRTTEQIKEKLIYGGLNRSEKTRTKLQLVRIIYEHTNTLKTCKLSICSDVRKNIL